jgi:hypothetical protein
MEPPTLPRPNLDGLASRRARQRRRDARDQLVTCLKLGEIYADAGMDATRAHDAALSSTRDAARAVRASRRAVATKLVAKDVHRYQRRQITKRARARAVCVPTLRAPIFAGPREHRSTPSRRVALAGAALDDPPLLGEAAPPPRRRELAGVAS